MIQFRLVLENKKKTPQCTKEYEISRKGHSVRFEKEATTEDRPRGSLLTNGGCGTRNAPNSETQVPGSWRSNASRER